MMDDKKILHTRIHYYLALTVAFCLPFGRLTGLFIGLMLLNWLIAGDLQQKFRAVAKNKVALLFILFFTLHLAGLFYTQNMDAGLFDIQVKLSLLIFPLLLCSRPLNDFQVRNVFMSFIAGGIIAAAGLLVRAVYTHYALGENIFFYQAFSVLVHPSYLSLYYDLSIAWLFYNMLKRDNSNGIPRFASIAIILFFSFIVVLLSSKMGLLCMFMVYGGAMILYIVSRKKYLVGAAGLVAMALGIFCLVRFVPEIRDRFDAAVAAVSADNANQSDGESTAVRMLIWKAANEVISHHPLMGAGTGDAKDELMTEYANRGMTGALDHKLNAHNEFCQVFVSIGFIGFIVLVLAILVPFFMALKQANLVYCVFLVLIILNFIPESMLETQAGVIFYAFFNSLLCFRKKTITNN